MAKKYTAARNFHYFDAGNRTREMLKGDDAGAIPKDKMQMFINDGWVLEESEPVKTPEKTDKTAKTEG